jgi:hypothetical protein
MITKELLKYIESQTLKGTPKETVFSLLKEKGWTDADIQEAEGILATPKEAEIKKDLATTPLVSNEAPIAPTGRIREYFAHFNAENMVEFLVGLMLILWQIGSITYITYFAILNSTINLPSYLLHFGVLVFGIALVRSASHRAQKRYINAIIGKMKK